ncbi:MAG: peptidylprolyl isomerase [bacterium]|nr:peptidylprolyl isomerase [bacterium]MDZ4299613.1 peptidylprolyl isomerase [Candidatus Sungbacteria bacterium]
MKRLPIVLGVSGVALLALLFVVGNRSSSNPSTASTPPAEQVAQDQQVREKVIVDAKSESAMAGAAMPSEPAMMKDDSTAHAALKNNMHLITLTTNLGVIKFKTYDTDAPKTVENFVTLAGKKFYDGIIFHRVIKGFMIQGGDPTGTGTGGPGYSFADELNPATESGKTGYKRGVVAMANAGPNTNGSQFFIMLADTQLPYSYTIFGHVVEGQDIVDKIGATQTGSGDRPVAAVTMQSVRAELLP